MALKWVWLFPITYSFHIGEEYWGGEGFPRWISRVAGAHLTENAFLIQNFIGMAFMIAGVVVLKRSIRWRWTLPTLGTVVLLNGILHVIGSVLTRSYSPGVVTGLLCWVPLGGFTLWFEWRNAPRWALYTGILGALCVSSLILFLARGSA
ncbi:MAG: HXXEE domain-containing protein [Bryobacteraceae bacterium]